MAASQPAASSGLEVVEYCSYVRGYHAYKDLWTPQVGEILLLKREPTNPKDSLAVAVMKEDEIVGHVPYNITSMLSSFLRRDCSKGFAEVTGNALNRGAGYGMEFLANIDYRIAGKFGGEFNLAVWQLPTATPNLISTKLTSAISARKNYVLKFCFAIANRQI